jgi:hypothetical protein
MLGSSMVELAEVGIGLDEKERYVEVEVWIGHSLLDRFEFVAAKAT